MKKRIIGFIIILIFSGFVFSEEAKQEQQSGDSSEVVIKGQLKIKVETEKPDIEVSTDINDVADEAVKTEEVFLGLSPEDIKDIKLSIPQEVNEERVNYYPELTSIETQPIFVISPKLKTATEMDKWEFKVTDPTGRAVYLIKGGGNLPDKIIWDGFDRDGQILKLNVPYLYMLTYVDKAGNPGNIMRKEPKIVNAIKYNKDGKLYIEISHKVLFDAKRKEEITDEGEKLIKEVENYLKSYNKFPVTIKFYSEDKELGEDQARAVEKILVDDLKIPKEFLKIEASKDESLPKNLRTIFIIGG
jgi:hypothetical protein